MTLSGATISGQNGRKSDGNKEILRIPQSFSITGASLSEFLVSYPRYSLGESYPSVEMQSVYSTTPADWTTREVVPVRILFMDQIELFNIRHLFAHS